MRNINDNAVQGRSSENYLMRNIIAGNILDTKYSRFTVLENEANCGAFVFMYLWNGLWMEATSSHLTCGVGCGMILATWPEVVSLSRFC